MNIVTPVPLGITVNTANVPTESARRDNIQREAVPQAANPDKGAGETPLGSESDRVKQPGQPPAPVTYERPVPQGEGQGQALNGDNRDNGEDESAGKQDAEQEQQQQAKAEQQEIDELKQRDREVRAHEQAHAAVGGRYAGAPNYDFESGPDGRTYAVGGEVPIDIAEENTPDETLSKMQQVKAAALAPAQPSAQDLQVAAEASRKAVEARQEIARQAVEESEARRQALASGEAINAIDDGLPNAATDPGSAPDVSIPTRTLSQEDEDPVAEAAGLASPRQDDLIRYRSQRIQAHYAAIATSRDAAVSQYI